MDFNELFDMHSAGMQRMLTCVHASGCYFITHTLTEECEVIAYMISNSDVYTYTNNIKLFTGAGFTLFIILLHVNNYV